MQLHDKQGWCRILNFIKNYHYLFQYVKIFVKQSRSGIKPLAQTWDTVLVAYNKPTHQGGQGRPTLRLVDHPWFRNKYLFVQMKGIPICHACNKITHGLLLRGSWWDLSELLREDRFVFQ